jgi:hypothetical protein
LEELREGQGRIEEGERERGGVESNIERFTNTIEEVITGTSLIYIASISAQSSFLGISALSSFSHTTFLLIEEVNFSSSLLFAHFWSFLRCNFVYIQFVSRRMLIFSQLDSHLSIFRFIFSQFHEFFIK